MAKKLEQIELMVYITNPWKRLYYFSHNPTDEKSETGQKIELSIQSNYKKSTVSTSVDSNTLYEDCNEKLTEIESLLEEILQELKGNHVD